MYYKSIFDLPLYLLLLRFRQQHLLLYVLFLPCILPYICDRCSFALLCQKAP